MFQQIFVKVVFSLDILVELKLCESAKHIPVKIQYTPIYMYVCMCIVIESNIS